MFELDNLLADAQHMLGHLLGMKTLARAVDRARKHLQTASLEITRVEVGSGASPLTGERVTIQKDGSRSWWQLSSEQRDIVIADLKIQLTRLHGEENVEAFRAALEMLMPDWRTSLLSQIAGLRGLELSEEDDAGLAAAQRALEIAAPREGRPVFEADAKDSEEGEQLPGLDIACDACGAGVKEFCDPAKHPEVPGDG
jgi:hypothetical protein